MEAKKMCEYDETIPHTSSVHSSIPTAVPLAGGLFSIVEFNWDGHFKAMHIVN